MKKTYSYRKNNIRQLLKCDNLDITIFYSTINDNRFTKYFTGANCPEAHYFFIDNNRSGFIEIDYLVEDLKSQTSEKIYGTSENDFKQYLQKFLGQYKNVAIGGSPPYFHIANLKKQFKDLNHKFNLLLTIKEPEEISHIKQSAQITATILSELKNIIKPKTKESTIHKFIKHMLADQDADVAFPTSIVSGKAIENTTVSSIQKNKVIEDKDVVCIDMGSLKNGYYSDCTRMYFMNDRDAQDNYERLTEGHKKVIDSLKPGDTLLQVLNMYNENLEKLNLPHTLENEDLGHFIGYSLHEEPFIYSDKYKNFKLSENMVFTLEPELKFEHYRLRIEDMVLITKDGAEILTELKTH